MNVQKFYKWKTEKIALLITLKIDFYWNFYIKVFTVSEKFALQDNVKKSDLGTLEEGPRVFLFNLKVKYFLKYK